MDPPEPFYITGNEEGQPPEFPWWVRVLAVGHVLSRVAGPAGFVVLGGAAAWRWVKVHEVDGWFLALGLAGLACPALCAAFRGWFERWGRRNWPETDDDSK